MPTILYAEDEPEHQTMMQVILKNMDVTLVEATDGEEALEKIEEQPPDLILLDLYIPKLDGYGVIQALKSNPNTRHIPIVVLSAWPSGDNRNRVQQAGCSVFIAKPYDPFELVKLVQGYLTPKTGPGAYPTAETSLTHN